MSDFDSLLDKVLSESGKTKEDVRAMIDKRKAATHGLLSDYGALYAVAKELGVDIGADKITLTKISDIKPKAAYNVAGRVVAVYPPKEFSKKDGGSGKIASLVILDGSGEARLVLWDNLTDLALKAKTGDTVLARNVYGREGLKGNVELQAGATSNVLINPKIDLGLPEHKKEVFKVGGLEVNQNNVNITLRVNTIYPPATFMRPDGKEGVRASFIGEDETGSVRVVLWGEAAKTKLERGDVVRIENAYTKEGFKQALELHVGGRGVIEKTDEKLPLTPLTTESDLKIREVKADQQNINLLARVVRVYDPRAYSNGTMSSMIVGDDTGTIRVILWNEKSSIVEELKRGDVIKIKNAYTKSNLAGEAEIHVGKYSEVVAAHDAEIAPLKEIEKSMVSDKKIIDLQNNDRYIRIRGLIVALDDQRGMLYTTCSNCNRRIQNIGDMWFCEACNENVEPQNNLRISAIIEDETGSIRLTAFRENAEKIIGMDLEEIMNIIGESGDETEPARRITESLKDKPITLVGRVRYSDFSDSLEFIVEDVETTE